MPLRVMVIVRAIGQVEAMADLSIHHIIAS
jgi:hypothetical protein